MRFTFSSTARPVECGYPPEVKDPVLLHHPTRDSVGYFCAVRWKDGQFIFQREDDSFNKQTFFGLWTN
jgi:hypothetical protein